jgi:hypothetical protein
MRICKIAAYSVNGVSFSSEAKARQHIQDTLGETVDKLVLKDILLGPGDRIKLVEAMMNHAAELVAILDGCNDAPEDDY